MSNCIVYVGGLAEATSDCQLRDLFGTYGAVVRVHVVRYKHSGKSAGYGFVEMGSDEQARHAVRALEGTSFAANCLRLYVTPHLSIHP
jgi:RNA recognition motif-containing protein